MKKQFNCSFLLLILLSFSILAKAQPEDQGKLSVGVVFSPDYASRYIKFLDEFEEWKELLDENDLPKFGYTLGFSLLYSFNNNFELESGLLFSSKGYAYKAPGEEGWVSPESESFSGWELNDPSLPLKATTTYNYRYLDIPIKMNWFFLQKRVRLFIFAGIAGSFFLDEFMVQERIYTDRTETSRYNQENVDFNAVTLSLTGGAGIEYPLSDRLLIRLNPELRHAVTPLADTPGKYYLWSAGVNTGISFRLQR